MHRLPIMLFALLALAAGLLGCGGPEGSTPTATEALSSWEDGPARTAIVDFVTRVTTEGGEDFVPASHRIAVFDNDGTLWTEQPIYIQLAFAFARVKALAPQHPEWRTTQPFQAVLEGDLEALKAAGKHGLLEIIGATHAGMTAAEFEQIAKGWLATARHPTNGRTYLECVYQPMVELLSYLRANGFKTWIVSAGGMDFMRPVTEKIYGIGPEQVVGSTIEVAYEPRDGDPVLIRKPTPWFVSDGAGKPVAIHRHIGRRPILAFGNSDGDFEMLEWTTTGDGARLGLLIHHDDAVREAAYDRGSPIGGLSRGLDEAAARGWILVSMKDDWRRVFPPTSEKP